MKRHRITSFSPDLEIYLKARNTNLLWRYEILMYNEMDPEKSIPVMEEDIFWDLAEIDIEETVTKSFRLTNLKINKLPPKLSQPVKTKILDLSNNNLKDIPIEWFEHLENLEILRIVDNQITKLPWEGISQLINLKIVDLRGNFLDEEFEQKMISYIRVFAPHIRKFYH